MVSNIPVITSGVFVYFQVIWEFGSSCVSWIHGDKHTAGGVQRQLGPFKHKRLHVTHYGLLNTQNLLSDHRQHLHLKHQQKNRILSSNKEMTAITSSADCVVVLTSMRLNSSKHAQAPDCARPLKNLLMAL